MSTAVHTPLADVVAFHRAAVANGEYYMLGQVELIQTAGKGAMDFRRAGPLLGRLRDRNDLVITTEWPELPVLTRALEEPCPACSRPCEQCGGSKTSMCQRCGGSGSERRAGTCASCAARGRYAADCPECDGRPVLMVSDCPACQGHGQRGCPRCNGAGVEGSGLAGAGRAKPCPDCGGQGRKIARAEQPLDKFVHGRIEGFVALGPVTGIVFHSVEGPARIEICDVRADAGGNLMVVLLEQAPGRNSNAFLAGGLPMIRPRAGS